MNNSDTARTTRFNNAGVRFYEAGLYNEAGDMFRAALEETLIFADPDEPANSSGVNVHVRRAENHLKNMNHLFPESLTSSSNSNLALATEGSTTSQESSPYFYNHPFLLDSNTINDDSTTSLQLTGAIIVFNLGLVHHMQSYTCEKAKSFYMLTEALVQDGPEQPCETSANCYPYYCFNPRFMMLQLAVTNNLGVWFFQNGNVGGTNERLERLQALYTEFGPCLSPLVQQGIKANLCWRVDTPCPLDKIQSSF
jgi:hypothetical protein